MGMNNLPASVEVTQNISVGINKIDNYKILSGISACEHHNAKY